MGALNAPRTRAKDVLVAEVSTKPTPKTIMESRPDTVHRSAKQMESISVTAFRELMSIATTVSGSPLFGQSFFSGANQNVRKTILSVPQQGSCAGTCRWPRKPVVRVDRQTCKARRLFWWQVPDSRFRHVQLRKFGHSAYRHFDPIQVSQPLAPSSTRLGLPARRG